MAIRFIYAWLVVSMLLAPSPLVAGGSSLNSMDMLTESSQMGAHLPETKTEPEKAQEENQFSRKSYRLWTALSLIVISGITYYPLRRQYLKKLTTKQ